MGIVKVVK